MNREGFERRAAGNPVSRNKLANGWLAGWLFGLDAIAKTIIDRDKGKKECCPVELDHTNSS